MIEPILRRVKLDGCSTGGPIAGKRRGRVLAGTVLAGLLSSGCGVFFPAVFAPGVYSGELPCVLTVVDGPTDSPELEFSAPIEMTIGEDRSFAINGVPVEVGQEVVRSIPTADLAFEIQKITRRGRQLTVEYSPQPTLVGITVEGSLVEVYSWSRGTIEATAESDLAVTDVDTTTNFHVRCEGLLSPLSEP